MPALAIDKKTAMSTDIIRVPIFPFNMVNAYLLKLAKGVVVVDTGTPGSERKIERLLGKNGLTFNDVKLIVVTHAHTDHAGGAARLRTLTKAPILAHEDDADFYSRKEPMTFCPTSAVGKLFYKTPVPHEPYEGFVPDIMMRNGDTFDLGEYGVEGQVRHTGGHTPGSIAVELSSQDALVGDLVASGILIGGMGFTGRAIRPPFEDDPHQVARELERMVQGGAKRFYMGHGGPLEAREVMRHAKSLASLPSHSCGSGQCQHAADRSAGGARLLSESRLRAGADRSRGGAARA
jgi:hydroxyacylglutathione hydrolase